IATAVSENYPRWLGWLVAVAGVGGSLSGLNQACMGEPTPISVALGIGAPTIITFWVIVVGILPLRASVGDRPELTRLGPSRREPDPQSSPRSRADLEDS